MQDLSAEAREQSGGDRACNDARQVEHPDARKRPISNEREPWHGRSHARLDVDHRLRGVGHSLGMPLPIGELPHCGRRTATLDNVCLYRDRRAIPESW